jgi:hypothetical protein
VYEQWLTAAVQTALQAKSGDSLVFVNAWNEWAEGAHLEPGLRWGYEYLQAHRRVIKALRESISRSP